MSTEKHAFQAEVSQLLDIVAHSLYSNKEVAIRELISNASDACDKVRYAALTQPDLLNGDGELKITISLDAAAGTLTVGDNGIGMSHDDVIENLGTIARSGTAAFVEQMSGDAGKDMSMIGQFGVGFYSAFMIADSVDVVTRKAGETAAWRWQSSGGGDFTVEEAPAETPRGTRVVLHLGKDNGEFAEPDRVRQIVRTYSDHIALPIVLAGAEDEQVNTASALWIRPKSEITAAQYKEFYHHVSHGFDDPWMTLHNRAEGVIEYTNLVFIPSTRPFDLFHAERANRLKLYVRRIFITDKCEELLPAWLRFVRGVVDSEDLPLNISREMLQQNPVVAKIRGGLVKRVLDALKKKADKEPDAYATFWETFGAVLKEGLYDDSGHAEALLALARFRSTHGDGWSTLPDYVGRMAEGQQEIFFITGDDVKTLAKSPQLEAFRARGVEVLLLTDPIDEFWVPLHSTFDGKALRSVTRGSVDLDAIGGKDPVREAEEAAGAAADPADLTTLIASFKLTLSDDVKDVRASNRMTDSAVCLVADEGDMDMHIERVLRHHQQLDTAAKRILEINPRHPLIRRLAAALSSGDAATSLNPADAGDLAYLLLDQARIVEGEAIPDPAAFSRRLATVLERRLGD